jgi:hypothetical protein
MTTQRVRIRNRKKTEDQATTDSSSENTLRDAASQGANAARVKAGQIISTVQQGTHRSVYSSVYALSYGVVFASMIIGHLIPGGSVVRRALSDGSQAAVKDFHQGRQIRQEAQETPSALPAL